MGLAKARVGVSQTPVHAVTWATSPIRVCAPQRRSRSIAAGCRALSPIASISTCTSQRSRCRNFRSAAPAKGHRPFANACSSPALDNARATPATIRATHVHRGAGSRRTEHANRVRANCWPVLESVFISRRVRFTACCVWREPLPILNKTLRSGPFMWLRRWWACTDLMDA